jgi:hypothetical protein
MQVTKNRRAKYVSSVKIKGFTHVLLALIRDDGAGIKLWKTAEVLVKSNTSLELRARMEGLL